MNKYKIVGIIDLLLGVPQLLMAIIFPLSVFPKLSQVYADFNVSSQPNFTSGYVMVVLLLIISVVNLFLGIKGFIKSKQNEKYFKYGIISAVISFFLTGILGEILTTSVILPIYNLTSQF